MELSELKYYIGLFSYGLLMITLACLCCIKGWSLTSDVACYILYVISVILCYVRIHKVSERREVQNDNT